MATYRTYSWKTLVLEAEPDFFKPQFVYEFSGGRKFYSSDAGLSGIYGDHVITTEDGDWLTTESGEYLVTED